MRDAGRPLQVFAARAPEALAIGVLCAAAAAPLVIMLLAALRDGTWHAAGARPLLAIGLAVALTAAVGLSLRRRDVQLTPTHLIVRASLFTRRVLLADLDIARARRVDLAEHTEYKAWLKKRGLSLPGFRAGSFRMWRLEGRTRPTTTNSTATIAREIRISSKRVILGFSRDGPFRAAVADRQS